MRSRRRSGFTYIELMAAAAICTVMLVMSAQMLALVMTRMAAYQRRLGALEAASSVLEVVVSQPYGAIDKSSMELPLVRELVDQNLSEWTVELQVNVDEEPVATKRIDLRMERKSDSNSRPVVLSTWKHET